MADNSSRLDASGVSETLASDDIAGVKYQRVKLNVGADNTSVDVQPPDADAKASSSLLPSGTQVWNGATWDRASAATADGAATTGLPKSGPYLFNESTFDRQRGNTSGTLLASAARTATTSSATQTNYNARGVHIAVNVTAKAAATTLTLLIAGQDVLSGTNYFTTSAAWSAGVAKTLMFVIYPGLLKADLATAGGVDTISGCAAPLPRSWFAQVFPSDASSVTYSVTYQLIV